MNIKDILRRRSDLSTFLVHLTRDEETETAKDRLKAILKAGSIEARSMFGHAKSTLEKKGITSDTQKCVCFTETPIEYVNLMLQKIDGRNCQFEPYGIAITKKEGRNSGVNPIWYVDITPGQGHDWLSNKINNLIDQAVRAGNFDQSDIAAITPFIEQMGSGQNTSGQNYRKEFWWEREWRKVGSFNVPQHCICFCPENEIGEFRKYVQDDETNYGIYAQVNFVDPRWSLEQIIARLADIPSTSIDLI